MPQFFDFDRLGYKLVHSNLQAFLLELLRVVRGKCYYEGLIIRNPLMQAFLSNYRSRLETVHHGHIAVHEYQLVICIIYTT